MAIAVADSVPRRYLAGAANSARGFLDWARASGYEVSLITDEDPRARVTVPSLRTTLEEVLRAPGNEEQTIERLIVYFAGHGVIREAEEGLWLLSDSLDELRAVAIEPLKRRLHRYGARQVTIISDACRALPSDVEILDLAADPVLGKGPRPISTTMAVDKFFAAQDGAKAFMIPGDRPTDDFCLFTCVLLEGLWGQNQAAFSRVEDDKVTSRSLGAFLQSEAARRASIYGLRLNPNVSTTFPEGEDYYFDRSAGLKGPRPFRWPDPAHLMAELPMAAEQYLDGLDRHSTSLASPHGSPPDQLPFVSVLKLPLLILYALGYLAQQTGRLLSRLFRRETTHAFERRDRWVKGDHNIVVGEPNRATGAPPSPAPAPSQADEQFPTQTPTSAPVRPSTFRLDVERPIQVTAAEGVAATRSNDGREWSLSRARAPIAPHSPGDVALIDFGGDRIVAIAIFPQMRADLDVGRKGLNRLVYRPWHLPLEAASGADRALKALDSNELTLAAASNWAIDLRRRKHLDPVLGVVSAYLYDSIGDIDSIRRMAYFYAERGQPIPFDIAMLADLKGRWTEKGFVVDIPSVRERAARTATEHTVSWSTRATSRSGGLVSGAWPWMRQGWAFIEDHGAESLASPYLLEISAHLRPARFTTFSTFGSHLVAQVFNLSPTRVRSVE